MSVQQDEYGQYRCTYCQNLIPQELSHADLGLRPDEPPTPGAIYPYDRCDCGHGKYVTYEAEGAPEPTESTSRRIDTYERVRQARYARLPVDAVRPNPSQPRRFFDAEALRVLAESITSVGLLEDVLVRPVGQDQYELVLGERRWHATRLAGLPEISAKIVELDDEETRVISIAENIHRQDLTKVEEAFAFKSYVDEGQLINEVGDQFGGMQQRVLDGLKVLNSDYFVKFQAEKIDDLQHTVDELRKKLEGRDQVRYEAKVVGGDELVGYVADGFEVAAALSGDAYVLRRRLR